MFTCPICGFKTDAHLEKVKKHFELTHPIIPSNCGTLAQLLLLQKKNEASNSCILHACGICGNGFISFQLYLEHLMTNFYPCGVDYERRIGNNQIGGARISFYERSNIRDRRRVDLTHVNPMNHLSTDMNEVIPKLSLIHI